MFDIINYSIQGYSYRESYYAMFDQGANYCNIYNLVMGMFIFKYQSEHIKIIIIKIY